MDPPISRYSLCGDHDDLALRFFVEGGSDAPRFRLNLTVGSKFVLDGESPIQPFEYLTRTTALEPAYESIVELRDQDDEQNSNSFIPYERVCLVD